MTITVVFADEFEAEIDVVRFKILPGGVLYYDSLDGAHWFGPNRWLEVVLPSQANSPQPDQNS